MKDIIKLGIIGYGFMGKWHLNHAGKMDEVCVKAVCDIDDSALANVPQEIAIYKDYKQLLQNEEINTVMITVPNHLHCEIAIAAANAKKNLIVEKPVAMNTQEFDQIYKAAQANNILFSVDQNRRWDPDYLAVKETLANNLLGNIFTVESKLYGVFGLVHDWHTKKEFGGGMMYDWGVHLLDQMLDLIPGKVTSVLADVRCTVNEEVDDLFKIVLNFENGHTARIELSTFMLLNTPRWYVAGTEGSLILDNFKGEGRILRMRSMLEELPAEPTNADSGPTRTFSTKPDNNIYTEPLPKTTGDWNSFFANYAQAMAGTASLIVKPQQTRRVLALMEACRKSSLLRKSVDFE